MKHRSLALVLSIAMCLSLSTTAFAVDVENGESETEQAVSENDDEQYEVMDAVSSVTDYSDEAPPADISDYTITLSDTSYTYDGKAKEPDVTVQGESVTLIQDTDYTVSYSDNTNAGTATVTITGIGDYTGEKQATFTITKADQDLTVSIDSATIAVGKTAQITVNGTGIITYKSGSTSVATVDRKGKVSGIKAGTAKITVTAAGDTNYNLASKTITVTVAMTGVLKDSDGNWYYYVNGVKDTSYSGFAFNSKGEWYIEKGKVTFSKNGVIKDEAGAIGSKGAWYYVVGSKVQTDYTGVTNYKNSNGWWYVKNGKVDFSANTVAKNKNGWWYVIGGKVQFDFTGLANYKNENGWWYIKNGKVDFTHNGVEKNKNGWWYVKNGKVDFSIAALIKEDGVWRAYKGKMDMTYTGLAANANGVWYMKDGNLKRNYTGIAIIDNIWWCVENGKVDINYIGWKTLNGSKYYVSEGAVAVNTEVVTGNNLYYFDSAGAVSKTIYGNKKMVALTYDSGPSGYTSTILDTLEEYDATATFFVLGRQVESYASTIERAYNMGCQIGNHTYNHTRLTTVSASTIKSEVSETNAAIKKVIGENPTVFRPPYGSHNSTVRSSVGMPIILWSIDTNDWETQDASSTISAVLDNVQDGDIVLMHDTYSSTATASQTIIPELVNRGYQLVTVEEMAMLRGGMESGVVYRSFR